MQPTLAIIDYGMGNLRSVARAWEKAGAQTRLVETPADIQGADALVFPGQGAIVDCMKLLKETRFDNAIRDWVAADKPFFGICLGLQALFDHSEEGDTPCLGIFRGQVKRFRLPQGYKIPHMGWNAVRWVQPTPVDVGHSRADDEFYFVHSYRALPEDRSIVWGETEYGGEVFCCAVTKGRVYATQFHPEKSQAKGLALYEGFLRTL